MTVDPKQLFSNRAEDYARYRPSYPYSLIGLLTREIGLRPSWVVADIGSGTGLSAKQFLSNGNDVFGVEPNAAMRHAAEHLHAANERFHSLDGSAESTGLSDASVDLVVAAQAFHWFDHRQARCECVRILRPPRWVTIMWNVRQTEASELMREYEALVEELRRTRANRKEVGAFYGGPFQKKMLLPHEQILDYEALKGLLLSASFAPPQGHEGHARMLRRLEGMFDRHQAGGRVRFSYKTEVYCVQLAESFHAPASRP